MSAILLKPVASFLSAMHWAWSRVPFFEFLFGYLGATVVEFEGSVCLQNGGVCIGLFIARVLSDLYIASCGWGVERELEHEDMYTILW